MKRFDEVESGDSLFIFVEELQYAFIESVRSVSQEYYNNLGIVNMYVSLSNVEKYTAIGQESMQYCSYIHKGISFDAVMFTTKYEMEKYIKEITMRYSEKVFNLNELLYHI